MSCLEFRIWTFVVFCNWYRTVVISRYRRTLFSLEINRNLSNTVPDSKVHGANMRTIWGRQDPGGPHVGPMNLAIWGPTGIRAWLIHSVESPSMVDPQWDIWYWGSKWNLHTVCWSAVGCEWGTTSVYFGITYVCFIPTRLPVFAVEPKYLLQCFLFLSKVSFELHIQNLQKISCWFKIWMGFVWPILIELWTSSIWGFL